MNRILVPTDFSPNAFRAINYAVEIAKLNQATVYLLHCIPELLPAIVPSQISISEGYNNELIKEAETELKLLQKSITDTEPVNVETLIYEGPVKNGIIMQARELNIDLVIMGTLGKTGIREQLLGSITASLIGHLEKPLLAIPLEFEWAIPQKIAFAIEDFAEAKKLAAPVMELTKIFDATIYFTLFTDEDSNTAVGYKKDEENVQAFTNQMSEDYKSCRMQAHHIAGSKFLEVIIKDMEEEDIHLLAIINHPQNIIQSLFHQSLSKKLAYQSKVPLLILKGQHA